MTAFLDRALRFVFIDPVRPLEIVFMVAFFGWAYVLLAHPGTLSLDQYSGLSVWSEPVWAVIQITVAAVQLASLFLGPERGITARYLSMTLAAGLWTLIAIGFWTSPSTTFGAFIYPGFAALAALGGIWLGWTRQQLRS